MPGDLMGYKRGVLRALLARLDDGQRGRLAGAYPHGVSACEVDGAIRACERMLAGDPRPETPAGETPLGGS